MSNNQIPKYVGPKPVDRLMTREEIKTRFDNETATAYSQEDPVYLPDYANTFELLVDAVINEVGPDASILDIGAGTGNLSLRLLRRKNDCIVTLVDFSENMLSAVPEVLADFRGRYATACADFFKADFAPDSFDAIISSFAIHHARGSDEYLNLYKKFGSWLKNGGIFACVDVVSGNNSAWSELNERGWREYLANYFDAAKIDHILANYHAEDSPLSVPEHLECLKEAGFAKVDVLWKRYNFALYCGKKE